jgi:putative alpha-1,2-mannosidase
MSLINPQMVSENVNSFISRFKKNGRVKDAFIAGIDMAEEQGGNDVDNVIAEAWSHDIPGINWDMAYMLLKNDANNQREGFQGFGTYSIKDTVMNSYRKRGWIPAGIMSCSKSLEYSYNDYCVSLVAKGLGKAEFQYYLDRSSSGLTYGIQMLKVMIIRDLLCLRIQMAVG